MLNVLNSHAVRARIRRVGRAVYWRLPIGLRDALVDFAYRYAGPLFRGIGHYETWKRRRAGGGTGPRVVSGTCADLVDTDAVFPAARTPGSIAIHAHMYYSDLAEEFAGYLHHMPFPFDLFVSVADERGLSRCRQAFSRVRNVRGVHLEVVPNRGRDVAPMLCAFGPSLGSYDFIAHVHTKKSFYNKGATDGWREYLLTALFGSEDRIRRVFGLLGSGFGIVYPQSYSGVPYVASSWLANRVSGVAWCHRLGVRAIPNSYFDFPVGSMFWARTEVLRALFESGVTLEDFEPELGQTDGTLAHTMERLIGVVARESGSRLAILPDPATPSWSPWRFEQYVYRGRAATEQTIASPEIRVVVFDVFDTLLVRPLVEPEQVKAIVARRAGGDLGRAYLQWRAEAERVARHKAGSDIGLDVVGIELGRLAGLDDREVAKLVGLELQVEAAAVTARPGMAELFRHALASNKRVVLASDMYLPRDAIESMLECCGVEGWHCLHVSSDIGYRKDGGELYDYILQTECVEPSQVLVVGDNERSDFQIPADRGMRTLHVLRPVDLARGHARLSHLVERIHDEGELNADLALGLILREYFAPLYFDRFDPFALVPRMDARALGYVVAGPMVFAFVQWLIERVGSSGVERLYFLAREGQFLRQVYDRVAAELPGMPSSSYLVVSRRAVNVSAISTLDDVVEIAKTYYGPHTLEEYVLERFGLSLDGDQLQTLHDRGLWKQGQTVMVRDGGIAPLESVLEYLLPYILEQADRERPALKAYLESQNLDASGVCAVVDIGYSGTIQRRLNTLVGGGVHGYYMATDWRIRKLVENWGVCTEGCFHHEAPSAPAGPPFIRQSFIAEKLLSSDDPQIVTYRLDTDGTPLPVFRSLSQAELATRQVRAEIRAGALAFVEDALQVRSSLLPDFVFPSDLALSLFEALVEGGSTAEQDIVDRMVLDDHYCGRGLVS